MEELDLSHNNFFGKIQDYLEDFPFLQKLSLSFNDFEGAVPESGIFQNVTSISVKGNDKLCGGLILMLCFLYLCWSRNTKKVPYLRFSGNSFLKLSYQNLFKATDGFSPANLVGVGSFGSVYKGILDQGEKVVAVKVLILLFHGASKSFIADCETLRHIKHRNVLKVLTACSSVDYHGNNFKALVYEFMANGSLEDWLHANENEDERLNIAIDIASALDYLHNHCSEPIVHCDLKPSNVLLDDEMIAHIGDFGLARFLLEANYDCSANQSSSVGIRGSVGYAAAEYGMGNEESTFGDVYSYGILLLEMFTGKRPTDNIFCDSLGLHSFVKIAFPKQAASIIADPRLFKPKDQSSTNSHKIQECLILKVGITCSEE
ncbi:hypothetical protein ACSBR1_027863 [Camellia fascicularis]